MIIEKAFLLNFLSYYCSFYQLIICRFVNSFLLINIINSSLYVTSAT